MSYSILNDAITRALEKNTNVDRAKQGKGPWYIRDCKECTSPDYSGGPYCPTCGGFTYPSGKIDKKVEDESTENTNKN